MTTTGISCRDLRVQAGSRELLRVPALAVPAGATLAVLGPNGAGKSTLLRALGLLSMHRITGEVLLDGTPTTRREMRLAAAAVLQRPILRRGTVTDNVASGLRFRGVARREARCDALPWLDVLGISRLADRDVRTLSGGEAQRVSIARALAINPRLLLLDEPFTGLDTTTRADLLADLGAALAGQRVATILVTHDSTEALALADRTALLISGRIRQCGPTREVLDNPVDPDTARLLGFTNLLPPVLTGQPHVLAARPEHCRLVVDSADAPDIPLVIAGSLRRTVQLGATIRFDVDTVAGPVTCLGAGEGLGPGTPRPGAQVFVAVSGARLLPRDGAGAVIGGRRDRAACRT